jgi:hypothetical protein
MSAFGAQGIDFFPFNIVFHYMSFPGPDFS